jgi:redox-sensitive bicupin YhaK (pirin superfamily)
VIDLRPAASRFHTRIDWLDSWHSFSFGSHYDPSNTGHGLLLVSNDDRVAPAAGFGTHAHRDMEIVTWVLEGELEHRDSEGHHGRLHPGLAQRMSAGTGIAHSEMNPSRGAEVHFLQMWVPPDTDGISPGYEQRDVTDELAGGELVRIASGNGDAAIQIHQLDAAMWVARLESQGQVTVPSSPHAHVFVARGDGRLDGDGADDLLLAEGDAVRLGDGASPTFTADGPGAEVVIWTTA